MTRRKLFALIVCIVLLFLFFLVYRSDIPSISKDLYEFYTANYEQDTHAYNMVTAIYLNYRFFDTIFETLTLLVSVIGIIHFSRHSQIGDANE